mmetsp:Transcript_85182/g.178015  ORF Transcript_85182/g.178015 Transcript_85182/m.178015 type:complete len:756 (+) Transcript_85182:128-2395(+)
MDTASNHDVEADGFSSFHQQQPHHDGTMQQRVPFISSSHLPQEVELAPRSCSSACEASSVGTLQSQSQPRPQFHSTHVRVPAAAAGILPQSASLDDLRTSLLQQPTIFSEDEVVQVDMLMALRRIACTSLTPLSQMILIPYFYKITTPGLFCRWFTTVGSWLYFNAYQNLFVNTACILYYCCHCESMQSAEVLIPVGLAVAARSMQTLGWLLRRPPTPSGIAAMKRWLFLKLAPVLQASPEFCERVKRIPEYQLEYLLRGSRVRYSLREMGSASVSMYMVKVWTMCFLVMASLAVPHFSKDKTMKTFNWVALGVSSTFFLLAVGAFVETKIHACRIKMPEMTPQFSPSEDDLEMIQALLGKCRNGYGEGLSWVLPEEERNVYEKCLKMCYLLDFPAYPGFWDQLARVGRLPDTFAAPLQPSDSTALSGGPSGKDKLLTEYVEALEAGALTPSLFGQQIVLGFPPLQDLLPSQVTLLMNTLRGLLWIALAFAWVLLPSLARGNFASTEPPQSVVEMLLELNWAIIGLRLFYDIFLLGPNKFKQLCKRLVSAHRALNTCMKGPQIAAKACLPFVDVRSHRHLLAWSEARGLLTNAASREMAALESELGMATLSLMVLGVSLMGHVLMHKVYTPGVLTGATTLATLACATELIPALFGGVVLNSTLLEQVEVIRTKLYEVTMREAYEPRISSSGEDDLSRARTYAGNLLTALQSDRQAFRLFGIVLDAKGLAPVASGVYTGSLLALSKVSEVTGNKQV